MTESTKGQKEKIRRFTPFRIAEHWLTMLTFGTLVGTGLVQSFFSLEISRWIILKAGGIDMIRLVHRCTGIVFFIATFTHVVTAAMGVVMRRWQPSMVITKNDFMDATHDMKYYLGIETSPALCDRYTYKQKFEYWGILTGGLLMIVTGIILWFPVLIARYLPGQLIPLAKALHSNEALVIVLLIAIWHIYNSIFSPEVFPLDTSVFTGFISRERMIREHPIELARREEVRLEEITGQGKERQEMGSEEVFP